LVGNFVDTTTRWRPQTLSTQGFTEIVGALNLALAIDAITFDELCRSLLPLQMQMLLQGCSQ
jgi:hypothetical protein